MAAYHFTAKIHSRARGASAVRAAAYRAAERLYDARLGVTEDYTRKADVAEAAILLPAGAPAWMQDRQELWNRVEGHERRKDAQVAQELEINLPRELSPEENWLLITDFARANLVAHGRVCDIAMHIHEAADGSSHPHAHVLMPLRAIAGNGAEATFGEKHPDCDWRRFLDRRNRLEELRELWCSFARDRAASLGIDLGPDWDHRSFADRGIDLEAQPKLGATAQRLEVQGNPADRANEQLLAQRRNGERLLARPEIVLEAITQRQSTFTSADLARWVHRHSADDQFQAVLDKAKALAICVGRDDQGCERYSTAEMQALEARMVQEAGDLALRHRHTVAVIGTRIGQRLEASELSDEQHDAARILLEGGDLTCLVGHAGAGKSTMLGELRRELERAGYSLRGGALSGIAAQNLSDGSGIEARTLASLTYAWDNGRDPLTARDVLVIDEAGMVGSRQLARFISEAKAAGAKLILVGDPEQLQAIEAGAAFRAVAERCPTAELTEIRRQKLEWQRAATRELATGQTADAIDRYRAAGAILATTTEAEARTALVARWNADRTTAPDHSRLILAHTRADVRALNEQARATLQEAGELGADVEIETTNGTRTFATGDRLLFLRNERTLGVRNGTLGTIESIAPGQLAVRADDGRLIGIDPGAYTDIDHGYAVTIHKSQGITVDSAFLLATGGLDRHLAYVGASRHRGHLTVAHSRESFPNDIALARTLGRERAKDTTLDYLVDYLIDYREAAPEWELPEPELPDPVERHPTLKPPTLDHPAPKPTDDFLRVLSDPKLRNAEAEMSAPPLTELEQMYHDMKAREQERERLRQLGIEKGRDLGL